MLVVLDKTPFYAEMGGQVADNGLLTGPECSLRVLDVKKTPKGYYVHTCVLESGIVKVGDHLNAQVDTSSIPPAFILYSSSSHRPLETLL